jgi:PadR family transcriptional regulator, regulatory protein PadR
MGGEVNFMQGTLDVLILRALANGRLHGYDVVAWIRESTGGVLEIEEGALYTSLHRMEARGWLAFEWATSPKGRRAKYYSLTPEGRRQLRRGEREWTRFAGAVARVFSRSEA